MNTVYTATATSHGGGRAGHVETSDAKVALDLAYPKEIGGSGRGTNPEQLAAMGYAACFASALERIAAAAGVSTRDARVTCRVSLGTDDHGGYRLSFAISVEDPSIPHAELEELVLAAHSLCPYSRAFGEGAPTEAHAAASA
jgi:lipoyl-dependent peroxiredoxin